MLVGKCVRIAMVLSVLSHAALAQDLSRSAEPVRIVLQNLLPHRQEGPEVPTKCATPFFVLAGAERKKLSISAKKEIAKVFERPEKQKSRLSPSLRVRIHYDTTGISMPALLTSLNERIPNSYEAYVDSVANVFDLSWTTMVESMGYDAPMADGLDGGGPEYDVYIDELGTGTFGFTTFEGAGIGGGRNKRFPTFVTIDNDFQAVRTKGIEGLKVTAAHEFFHAVQLGSYGVWHKESDPEDFSQDFYFYELSAVWMEDIVFPSVKDYLFDLPAYFELPTLAGGFRDLQGRSLSFATFNFIFQGYERALWAHFLAKRFGRPVIRQTWEAIRTAPFLKSMDDVLNSFRTSFADEYATFAQWNMFTGSRADTTRFYPEGHLYPLLKPNVTQAFNLSSTTSVAFAGYPLSTQVCLLSSPADSIYSIVANISIENALLNAAVHSPFEIRFSGSTPTFPYRNLSNGMKAGFSSSTPEDWRVQYVQSATRADVAISAGPYPNPVQLSQASRITLPVETNSQDAEVFLLSSSLDLVYSGTYSVSESFGKRYVYLPTNDLGSTVASGIYFVIVHCPDAEFRWKVAIIR